MSTPADPAARFQSLLDSHRGIVVKVARAYTQHPADAADLEQELWLQLWLSLPSYAERSRPSTWIYRVCLNPALSWRRGIIRRDRRIEPEADITHVATDSVSPADSTADREILEKLYAAIRLLSAFDRGLVVLMLDGLAYREIAELTGLTENHVGVALTRARKRLTGHLKGITDELE